MPNRLASESSAYLRQHAHNPVDWYPWGEEAIARARDRQRPLLVSIGYAACHWCHVMERESFEDPEVAALMNDRFVCVKVDREERPDVDAICMEACQTTTGQGGWPLNAFLTPELEPFWVGTYFPPEPRHGLPSWRTVLEAVAEAWDERRDQVRAQAASLRRALGAATRLSAPEGPLDPAVLDEALAELRRRYDPVHGGFGGAPKFPQASAIELLLARGETQMALGTLRAMAAGGIFDQLSGGFARYAVDASWTVPHFEKMLYDNALLARAYLHGWQVSGDPLLRRTCERTLDWALGEMRSPDGGFYSSLDADSEGVEGRFYVWTARELRDALGEDAEPAMAHFGATERGNFEGANVLCARGPVPERLESIRERLLEVRSRRTRPGVDDKVLTSWNALLISSLAQAGAALGRRDWLEAAEACAELLLSRTDGAGRLLRTDRVPGFLDDHAHLLEALLTLYEATFRPRWFAEAQALAATLVGRFADHERGGFLMTASDHEHGFERRRDLEDSPLPSGSSSAAFGLLRLARLTGERAHEERAIRTLAIVAPFAARHPHGFGHALCAIDFALADVREVAIVPGADARAADELASVVRGAYRPHVVLAGGRADGVPLLAGREPVGGQATAYVCRNLACRAPVTSAAELAALL
ncbi:MAG TPA: thioredoxin domain-containing protein [Solirubrobacteraceae bacterium]|nr:thioredoxin domain-containing protein [Solirubrobacteraceae bacterium]